MSDSFASIIYTLCFLTSGACAWLLCRSYVRTRARLLLWSGLCFCFLALNNLAVVLDLLIVPQINFTLVRVALALTAVCLMLFGLIWDREESR